MVSAQLLPSRRPRPRPRRARHDRGAGTATLAPRELASFAAAAEEAAISRLDGGIHFREAIEMGLEQGRSVGRAVEALRFRRRRLRGT